MIWLNTLRNISIKLATGKYWKNSNFELNIQKNTQQNVRIKISCQN